MKNDLPFDDFVKKQLSNYTPDVPQHIWKNIAAAKRKSKPKGFWATIFSGNSILLFSFILLIGGGTAYLLFSEKNRYSAKNSSEENNISSQKGNQSSAPKDSFGEKNSNESKPVAQSDKALNTEKNIADAIADNASKNLSNTSHQNNLFVGRPDKSNIKNNFVNGEISGNYISSDNENPASERKPIMFSPFILTNARVLSGTKILNSNNIKLPDCPAIEKNAAGNKTYWEVYAGPDYAFESYKSYGDTASNNYLQKRKASTKFASAFSAGVRYTKVFNNGTSVRAGINYTQVNEKFLYFNPNEIRYVTVITTRVVIRSPGDTIYINDTLQYQQSGARTKTTYNRYRNIDIPLVIGYELGNGKIHANINAGVIINIYSWYKGDVLDTLYQPVTITTGKGSSVYQFKTNIGVGFLGSVSVYYKITDKLHILLEPYFRYNLSPMSKANLNLQQKYHIAGLRAGVRFDLK